MVNTTSQQTQPINSNKSVKNAQGQTGKEKGQEKKQEMEKKKENVGGEKKEE